MGDLLNDSEFNKLEKEYKLLSRFRKKKEDKKIFELPYVIVDIETTGLDPTKSEIIEIGAIKVQNGKATGIFESLLKPVSGIPPFIENLTGISDEMTLNAPAPPDVYQKFMEFTKDHVLVAHNSDFDIPFLKYHIKNYIQQDLSNKILCTVKISRAIVPGLTNYKLHTVAKHFRIPISNRHRAMGDVEITFNVWSNLLDILRKKKIEDFEDVEKFMR